MNRRTVIKNLALVLGGAVLLPACIHKATSYVQLKHIQLTEAQQNLIADIAETIIPKTSTPGAKELNLPAFILKMLDDCYNKKNQLEILKGVEEFNALVSKKYSRTFGDLSQKEREELLITIENSSKTSQAKSGSPARNFKPQKDLALSPLNTFYWAVKQQSIFAYTTSQYFMTKEIVYELIPGRYNAHFPVKNIKTA